MTVATLAWTSGAWVQERWIVRTGEAFFVRIGYLVLAPGIAIVAVAAMPDVVPFWVIHVGWAVAGLGMGLAYSAHAQAVLRCSPAERYGAATASLQLLDNLGVALGTGCRRGGRHDRRRSRVGSGADGRPGARSDRSPSPSSGRPVRRFPRRGSRHRSSIRPRPVTPKRARSESRAAGSDLPGASAEPRGYQSSAGPPDRSRFAASRRGTRWRRRSRPGGSLWR